MGNIEIENDPLFIDIDTPTRVVPPPKFKPLNNEYIDDEQPNPVTETIEETDTDTDKDSDTTPRAMAAAARASAKFWVNTADKAAQTILPNQYKKLYLTRTEIEVAKKARNKNKSQLTEYERHCITAYDEWHDQCDMIPMDNDTKDAMIEPLSEMLRERGGNLSPQWRLTIAAGMWAMPLALPFLTRKRRQPQQETQSAAQPRLRRRQSAPPPPPREEEEEEERYEIYPDDDDDNMYE